MKLPWHTTKGSNTFDASNVKLSVHMFDDTHSKAYTVLVIFFFPCILNLIGISINYVHIRTVNIVTLYIKWAS